MIYLGIAILMSVSFVAGALTTRKVVGAQLRYERECHFWTKQKLTSAADSVLVLTDRVNKMIADPRIALRAAERAYKIRAKDWSNRYQRAS